VQGQLAAPAAGQETGVGVDPILESAVRGLEILVVEDDPDTQECLCKLLELYGARVTCASSAEAVRLASAESRYDVVVSDLELPGHDGLWLVSELRRMARPDAPAQWAILLTGSARPGIERIAIQAGFDLCLKKPIEAHSLLRAIAQQRGTSLP
jgi:CheY-like chemotaxis protein